jgi:hypothetical protein
LYGEYQQVADVLASMGVPPDFESDPPLRYTHRHDSGTDIYFVANPQDADVRANCRFRVTGKPAEIWDPMTGRMWAARSQERDGRTQLTLALEPHGSVFVVFPVKASSLPAIDTDAASERKTLAEVAGPWEVSFEPQRGAPARIELDKPIDLAAHADPGVKHFSGLAAYTTNFELDLGDVQVMAAVKVNGRDVGVAWKRPFRLDVTDTVRAGRNTLEITVANLWPNRLIGDASLPEPQRVARTTWNPYRPDTPLPPSGLLGPVTLQASTAP